MNDISSADVRALAAEVTGPVLVPGSKGYEIECAGYNRVPQRPALVVGATGDRDVLAAVRFAVRHAMPVGVLGSGHGSMVSSDGAVLINTRRMDDVSIDAMGRSARVGAGVRMRRLVEAAAPVWLAPLTGSAPEVTVVGYTLGGGLGPLSRGFGFASDRVRSVDMVTADGSLRHVTSDSEPDLFWAIRGGGANFGVVTAMEVGLVHVSRLYGGGLFFDGDHAAAVLSAWSRWTTDLPEEMTSSFAFVRVPPTLPFPEPMHGKIVAHVRFAYLGAAADGAALVEPIRAVAPRIVDTVTEIPFTDVYSMYPETVDPLPLHDRSILLRELPPDAVDVLIGLCGPAVDSPPVLIELQHLGGALSYSGLGTRPSAVSNRDAAFALHALGHGGSDQKAAIESRLDELIRRLDPWSTGGTNVNYLTTADTAEKGVRQAYDLDTYRRLVTVKRIYDPNNTFRINFNINPA